MREVYNRVGGGGEKSSLEVNLLSQSRELRENHRIWGGDWEVMEGEELGGLARKQGCRGWRQQEKEKKLVCSLGKKATLQPTKISQPQQLLASPTKTFRLSPLFSSLISQRNHQVLLLSSLSLLFDSLIS